MWRFPILLLLAAPLLYFAYREGEALVKLDWGRFSPLSDARLDRCEKELDDSADSTKSRGRPGQAMSDCLLRGDDRCRDVNAAESKFSAAMLPVVQTHARRANEVRDLFNALDRNAGPDAVPGNIAFGKILRDRQTVQAIEKDVDALFAGNAPETKVLDKVRELEAQPMADPGKVRRYRAKVEQRKITGLEGLPDRVDRMLSGKTAVATKALDEVLKQLDDYVQRFGDKSKESDWARTALARWQKTRRLLVLFEGNRDAEKAEQVHGQFRAFAELLKGDKPDDELRAWVRAAAEDLCKRYLKATLELDSKVRIKHGENWFDEERKKVKILFKGKAEEVTLESTKHNEFTLPADEVQRYYVEGTRYSGPMEPTKRSEAAHFYNSKREGLKWTPDSLSALVKALENKKYAAELREERERAEALLKAVEEHGELFGAGK